MRRILTALVFAFASQAQADVMGVHVYTAHWTNKFNNVNTGLYYKTDTGLMAGTYRNSYNRQSFYAGFVISSGPFELMAGAATGYRGVCPRVCKDLTLMLVPSLALPITDNASLRLSVPNGQGVHLSMEYKL